MFLEWLRRLFTRVSPLTARATSSVRRQLEDCARLVERKGWRLADRYVDDDVSAYNGRGRPEYRRMLDDLTHPAESTDHAAERAH